MTAINRQPSGWLGFLGIKNFGRNPSSASEVLAPTWDLADLYLNTNRSWTLAAATLSAIGTNTTGAVPPGQVWAINSYSYRSNILVAGNVLQMSLALVNLSINATSLIGEPSIAAGPGQYAIAYLPRPMVLNPGESLGVFVSAFTGANIGCEVSFSYTRLDA